jgi:O-antigen/teichoic acid export membrane protein
MTQPEFSAAAEPAPSPPAAAGEEPQDILDTHAAGGAALRGSVLRSFSYVLGILLSLLSARILLTHLGVADFGDYTIVLALVTIVSGFTEGGLNSIVIREFATLSGQRRSEMMASAIGIRLVLTVVGVSIAVAFAAIGGYDSTLVIGTALAGTGLVLQLLQSTLSTTLQAQLRFGWVSAVEILRQLVNVGLLIVLVLSGAGLVPLFAVAIPASAISLLVTVPLVLRYTSLRPSFHLGRWWHLLRETLPWAIVAAVSIVYFRFALVVMSLTASKLQTGYFSTSFRISEVLLGIPNLVVVAAFPILARAEREDSARFDFACGRMFQLALVAAVWMVMCLEVGAGFAIHLIAAHKADPAIAVLRIQGLSLIGSFIAVACGYPMLMLRRYRSVLRWNILSLLVSGSLTLALAPSLGARGAAIAAFASESVLGISQIVTLKRAAPGVSLPLTGPLIVLVAGLCGVGAGLLAPVDPVLGALLASLVYLALLRLTRRLPPELGELAGGRLSFLLGA